MPLRARAGGSPIALDEFDEDPVRVPRMHECHQTAMGPGARLRIDEFEPSRA